MCWRASNHDDPFEEVEQRVARVADNGRRRLDARNPKTRGRPSRDTRGKHIPDVKPRVEEMSVTEGEEMEEVYDYVEEEKRCLALPSKSLRKTAIEDSPRKNPRRRCSLGYGRPGSPHEGQTFLQILISFCVVLHFEFVVIMTLI